MLRVHGWIAGTVVYLLVVAGGDGAGGRGWVV